MKENIAESKCRLDKLTLFNGAYMRKKRSKYSGSISTQYLELAQNLGPSLVKVRVSLLLLHSAAPGYEYSLLH